MNTEHTPMITSTSNINPFFENQKLDWEINEDMML